MLGMLLLLGSSHGKRSTVSFLLHWGFGAREESLAPLVAKLDRLALTVAGPRGQHSASCVESWCATTVGQHAPWVTPAAWCKRRGAHARPSPSLRAPFSPSLVAFIRP